MIKIMIFLPSRYAPVSRTIGRRLAPTALPHAVVPAAAALGPKFRPPLRPELSRPELSRPDTSAADLAPFFPPPTPAVMTPTAVDMAGDYRRGGGGGGNVGTMPSSPRFAILKRVQGDPSRK